MWPQRIFAWMLAVCLTAGAAHGALVAIEEAYEVELTALELPAHAGGRVGLRPCAGCARVSLALGEGTRYLLGGSADGVTLPAFREAIARTVDPRRAVVYVFYDPDALIVTRLVLDGASR